MPVLYVLGGAVVGWLLCDRFGRSASLTAVGFDHGDHYVEDLLRRWQQRDVKLVRETQAFLGVTPDGIVGPRTEAAIRSLQSRAGLPVTGDVDYATMNALVLG